MAGKVPLVVFAVLMIVAPCFAGVTLEQMRQSIDMVRKVCQPKFKVSDELVDGIGAHQFPNDKGLKCYIHCLFEMMGMMKKTKVNYEAAMKQIDIMMPDEMKEPNKNALTACKDTTAGMKDPCEAGYTMIQCIVKVNPDFVI